MLINVLAENFDSIPDINWDWVIKIPEFSGYSSISLRRVFYHEIIGRMTSKLGIHRTELTLQTIVETVKDLKFSSANKNNKYVIARQKQIIDYFEKKVQKEKIEFVELTV